MFLLGSSLPRNMIAELRRKRDVVNLSHVSGRPGAKEQLLKRKKLWPAATQKIMQPIPAITLLLSTKLSLAGLSDRSPKKRLLSGAQAQAVIFQAVIAPAAAFFMWS